MPDPISIEKTPNVDDVLAYQRPAYRLRPSVKIAGGATSMALLAVLIAPLLPSHKPEPVSYAINLPDYTSSLSQVQLKPNLPRTNTIRTSTPDGVVTHVQ